MSRFFRFLPLGLQVLNAVLSYALEHRRTKRLSQALPPSITSETDRRSHSDRRKVLVDYLK